MKPQLRKLEDQVIVITGAASGIGIATARMAAGRGARVVLAARNVDGLREIQHQLNTQGYRAHVVRADVTDDGEVQRLADEALATFGRIDTWVNNAGVAIYGELMEVPLQDQRQLFEVDFWGVVYGCRVAIDRMQDGGGALINVGSVVSDVSLPLQGIYSAAKHAGQGYTDALRMELEHDEIPISVTRIEPTASHTPEAVAEAILHAAEHPVRELYVGGNGKAFTSTRELIRGRMERSTYKRMSGVSRGLAVMMLVGTAVFLATFVRKRG